MVETVGSAVLITLQVLGYQNDGGAFTQLTCWKLRLSVHPDKAGIGPGYGNRETRLDQPFASLIASTVN